MPSNSLLTLLALLLLYVFVGKKLLSSRDLLLVAGAAGSIGFLLAGVFHSWALIVGLVLLIAQSFYLAFVYRHRDGGLLVGIFNVFQRVHAQTAFVMAIALVVFVVFAFEQGRRNVNALSDYIEIYEPNSSIEWVPRVSNDVIGMWILKTGDPASSVLDHYQLIAARDGWHVDSYAPPAFASLRKAGIKVSFMASDSEFEDTIVVITLSNAAN